MPVTCSEKVGTYSVQARLTARNTGSSGCSRGAIVSSRYSLIAFDSNSDTLSSMRSTGTFLCGEIARNQSGRLSGSIWRNSNSVFFSRNTIAERCTHGQVLKLTSMYFGMTASDDFSKTAMIARGSDLVKRKSLTICAARYYIFKIVMDRAMESAITAKGQATIPKAIREHLGLKPGDRVKFFVHPDGSVVLLPKLSASALRDIVRPRRRPVTIEEMGAAAADGAANGVRRTRRP